MRMKMRTSSLLTDLYFYAHKFPMGRPLKKTKRVATNLTLDPQIKANAAQFAYDNDETLSELIERLLSEEIARSSVAEDPATGTVAVRKDPDIHAGASAKDRKPLKYPTVAKKRVKRAG